MALTAAVALSLCLLLVATDAQRPMLNLFQNGVTEAQFFVPVDTPEFFNLQLVTNPNLNDLVTDPQGVVHGIEVVLSGGSGDSIIEFIAVDSSQLEPDLSLTSEVVGQVYRYLLVGGVPTLANYSTLLSTLQYRTNLSGNAAFDPSRNISITAFDEVGNGPSLVAYITLVGDNQQTPEFSQTGVYEVVVVENSRSNGDTVATIAASHPNGVSYSLGTP